jgi:hypothetical protein
MMYVDLSEGLYEDATKVTDQQIRAELAQSS